MITSAIISLVVAIVNVFDALLPSFTLPSWLTSDSWASGVANTVGGMLAAIRGWFPVDPLLTVLHDLLVLLPMLAAYAVFEWVWRHVPTIAGFGTGNG